MAKKETKKPVKKVSTAKKVAPRRTLRKPTPKKKEVKKEVKPQINAKLVGKTLVVVLPNKSIIKKPGITEKELKSIEIKISVFNKTNNPVKLEEIRQLLKTEKVKKEETTKSKAKGVKSSIKKIEKKGAKVIDIDKKLEKSSEKISTEKAQEFNTKLEEEKKEGISKVVESISDNKENQRGRERYR